MRRRIARLSDMSEWTPARIVIVAVLLVFSSAANAGGPLEYADDGRPVRWPDGGRSIVLTLDRGPLGALTNAEADALVAAVREVWSSVTEATVRITTAPGELAEDVDPGNFGAFIGPGIHGFNPVVYDVDGRIIDDLYGAGTRNRVLGFSGIVFPSNYDPPEILETHIVLNGRFLDGEDDGVSNPEVTRREFESVIVHEFGHTLGLGHSQINALDPTNTDQPTMFPLYYGGDAMRSLAPDDIAWVSYLYPSDGYSSFGAIAGEVIHEHNWIREGYQGLNVIARDAGGTRIDAVSCVSGYVFRAGQGPAPLEGGYLITGLPPGLYKVEIEEVLGIFIGGSVVGPLDPPVRFPGIAGGEFYDGPTESAHDNPNRFELVTVAENRMTSGIDIILNTEPLSPLGNRKWTLYR